MNESSMGSHPHDAVIRLQSEDIFDITTAVDDIVDTAIIKNNILYLINWAERFIASGQVAWMSMAHLVYETHRRWDEFNIDDDFLMFMAFKLNRSPQTIKRMLEIWTWVFVKPKHNKQRFTMLLAKPPSGLWQIKQAAKEGLLNEEDWEQVVLAPNKQALSDVRKKVRGERGRAKDALKIMIESDGTLKARRTGHYENIGFLNVNMADQSDIIAQAIERMINSAGIFER